MPTFDLTDEQHAALRQFFPRMLVASVVASDDAAAEALYQIDPTLLPWETRQLVAGRGVGLVE